MNYLIIECHPYKGSFNAAVSKTVQDALSGEKVKVVNLVDDGFNPVMSGHDLNNWRNGQSIDPLVRIYQQNIEETDYIIFPIPIWWGVMPAVLKGFCDKVFLPKWAYNIDANGNMIGLLTDKKAIVITTMQTPYKLFVEHFKNPIEGAFVKDTLGSCGIQVEHLLQIDQLNTGGKEYAQARLKEVKNLFKK